MSSSTTDATTGDPHPAAVGNGNIACRLRQTADRWPDERGVIDAAGRVVPGGAGRTQLSFRELDEESDRLARGLVQMGVQPGTRLVLMVRPGVEFIALTFALFKAGAVIVLIDPGMGRSNIFRCLEQVEPEGFVAIPVVQAIRCLSRRRFPMAKYNVTVGRRWFWGGLTYRQLRVSDASPWEIVPRTARDPAAIIFTSGSTGPPKGVLYEHGMFNAQVDLIRDFYDIQPGECDLPGFPLFALFNAAMGVTTVVPDMNPTRPADVDPEKILSAIREHGVTQAFGSPAFWNRIGRHCEAHNVTLSTIRRGLSAGGPVPTHVLQRMSRAFTGAGADLHTPYGATESLPVASIAAREVLEHTAARTRTGAGTCVGSTFPGVDVRIVEITAGPIATIDDVQVLPRGQIGEILVRGPSVTREYFRQPEATALAKVVERREAGGGRREAGGGRQEAGDRRDTGAADSLTLNSQHSTLNSFWHRLGDVGYLDDAGLLWFCGRMAHIVTTERGRMFSVCCEAIFNEHPRVYRSALVGVGHRPRQRPVIVVEPEDGQFPASPAEAESLRNQLLAMGAANPLTESIHDVLFHRSLPVDTRHNVKINREALAVWASGKLSVEC